MILETILELFNILIRFVVIFSGTRILIWGIFKSVKEHKLKYFSSKRLMIVSAANFFMAESMMIVSAELGKSVIEFKIWQIVMLILFILFGITYIMEQKLGIDILDIDSFL